jgi:hypothetical protein
MLFTSDNGQYGNPTRLDSAGVTLMPRHRRFVYWGGRERGDGRASVTQPTWDETSLGRGGALPLWCLGRPCRIARIRGPRAAIALDIARPHPHGILR